MSDSDEIKAISNDIKKLNESVSYLDCCLRPVQGAGGCPAYCPAPLPDITTPLLRSDGGENNPDIIVKLGPLAGLIGTWASSKTTGFCVMPLPEATAPNQFILKNFYYFEEITFSALAGKVANRGGTFEQNSYTLFYEQRVYFSDQPQENQLVHAENGTWLHLLTATQLQGTVGGAPIPSPPAPDPIPPQDPALTIVKQISIPHGNSILATGSVTHTDGPPTIPDVSCLPINAPESYSAPYGSNTSSNPNINPNIVLVEALKNSPPVLQTYRFDVDSNCSGGIANVPFVKRHADVNRFTNTLWLELLATGEWQIQYSQNVSLSFPGTQGNNNIIFPHILANTLRRVR